MIVREKSRSFVLVGQHDHALVSGEFARRWAERPTPFGPTLYAVENHDVAWRGPDREVLWNEEANRPYSFLDYPLEAKLSAQRRGIDLVETHDAYAACLCSMHYSRFLLRSENLVEVEFREGEEARQRRLRGGMTEADAQNLERNFRFLRLCDGLSLFLFLYEPGRAGYPPPTPDGFELDGTRYDFSWQDGREVRLDPFPLTEPFEVAVPYREVGKDRRPVREGVMEIRVSG